MLSQRLLAAIATIAMTTGVSAIAVSPAKAVTFTPPSDNQAPRESTGGASRGQTVFTPPADGAAPQRTSGGASRGEATFTPPTDARAPQRTSGGASRHGESGLALTSDSPTAISNGIAGLIPQSNYGLTLSERPTILVYLPQTGVNQAFFSIKDEEKNLHYQTTIPISPNGGIVAIALPEDAPPLQSDRPYQWFFALKLDEKLRPSSPLIDGWIKRVEPDSLDLADLEPGDRIENVSALASAGVWYDSAAILWRMRRQDPQNAQLSQHWHELLGSVGLGELADATLP